MDARSRGKLLASVFGLRTVSFLGLVLFAFVLLKDQQDNLRQKTYDETGMAAVQIRLHYEALMGSLAQVEARHLGTAVDDVVLQFDILFERLTSLPSRPSYDILLDEETLAIQANALKVLTSLLPNIDRAAEGGVEALRGLYATLAPLRLSIERLAHRPVHIASERRVGDIGGRVRSDHLASTDRGRASSSRIEGTIWPIGIRSCRRRGWQSCEIRFHGAYVP